MKLKVNPYFKKPVPLSIRFMALIACWFCSGCMWSYWQHGKRGRQIERSKRQEQFMKRRALSIRHPKAKFKRVVNR